MKGEAGLGEQCVGPGNGHAWCERSHAAQGPGQDSSRAGQALCMEHPRAALRPQELRSPPALNAEPRKARSCGAVHGLPRSGAMRPPPRRQQPGTDPARWEQSAALKAVCLPTVDSFLGSAEQVRLRAAVIHHLQPLLTGWGAKAPTPWVMLTHAFPLPPPRHSQQQGWGCGPPGATPQCAAPTHCPGTAHGAVSAGQCSCPAGSAKSIV